MGKILRQGLGVFLDIGKSILRTFIFRHFFLILHKSSVLETDSAPRIHFQNFDLFLKGDDTTRHDTETPPRLQARIPSHPGIKYPVRESPHSDLCKFAREGLSRTHFYQDFNEDMWFIAGHNLNKVIFMKT